MTLNSLSSYGINFQIKVISALLNHKEFLVNINDLLSDEEFDNSGHKWIIKEIIKYYNNYHTTPSMEVLKIELKKLENEVLQIAIKEQLRLAYEVPSEDLEYVENEFSSFCKNQQLKKALLVSVDLLNAGDFESIRHLIDNALKAGQDKNIGHEYKKDIESRYREDNRMPIPTPWNEFNSILQGGLGAGDFGLIFGNPGGGKSWVLVALGACALKLGYNVIHYTLELSEDYVGKRYDAINTGVDVDQLKNFKTLIDEKVSLMSGELIIKEYSPGKASIHTIESHIRKCDDLGFKADMIIIDYVDLLRSGKNKKERKDEIDDIYIQTKGLAKSLKIPVWSVSQVNRAGSKDDIIEGDKAAGSYDKMMIADVSISLSRKKKDKSTNTGRFHFMKNRYGVDGMTFSAHVNLSNGDIQITGDYDDDYEEPKPKTNFGGIDSMDKKTLSKKFFELNITE
jgi:replicative DNA helicase